MCMTYRRNFKPEILAAELYAFLHSPREPGCSLDAAIAFSGGKDSTASLFVARQRFGMKVVAILVDNGFIPRSVIENGLRACDRVGVELVIVPVSFAADLKRMMEDDFRTAYPCYRCTDLFHQAISEYCGNHRINRVILGRNWWRWLEPEVRAVRWVRHGPSGKVIQFLSLPFALQMTEASTEQILRENEWRPVEIHGNSTNCLIPGLVEFTVYKRLGYHPELNLLSREVISGYLTKAEARERLKDVQDLSPELRERVDVLLARRDDQSGRASADIPRHSVEQQPL
jgi:hypothetical protein